ncbi:MAG: cation:proton antiporter [Geminicoccaceae bacterium]
MHHDIPLISTTAMAFVVACVLGFVAHRLRLPPLVGYLLAGVAIGPFSPGFVADSELAGQLAEMGVLLLMFGVGLHFSIGDLMAVRWIAIPGAIGQIVIATAMGAALALAWGWSLGAGLVFGLSLSVASTIVLLRALEERNALTSAMGRIAVGWLIVEDLAMVLTLVLLPASAEMLGGHLDGEPAGHGIGLLVGIGLTLLKVAAFIGLAVLLGPKAVPWLLKQAARAGSRELFTLTVLAVALGIAYGSSILFGVSLALGAFFAGVVLSESEFSHRAATDSLPLQDAFAILFFVSVGMLFDPTILVREPLAVLAVLAVILVGKSIAALAMVLALGFPPAIGLSVSASLAQIGEFSFILAGLGIAMGVLPPEGRDLILAGALLSITLNPLAFAASERLQAACAASRRIGRWFAGFGQPRLAALQQDLAALARRTAQREDARRIQIRELVGRFPVFADLPPEAWEDLLLLLRHQTASPGERIIRAGARGQAAYFIEAGAVEVAVGDRHVRLGPGDYFGEMALLTGGRRSADVTALDYCNLAVLAQRDFRSLLPRYPQLRAKLQEMAQQRAEMNRAQRAAEPVEAG